MVENSDKKTSIKIITDNRRARFDFFILEDHEAGIVLSGAEVKSIRAGAVSLNEAFIRPINGELYLINATIQPYKFNHDPNYEPGKRRKLLMHREEIDKIIGKVSQKGLTIVPLKLYFKGGRVKVAIGLAKGKLAPDKRQTIKDKENKRSLERIRKNYS